MLPRTTADAIDFLLESLLKVSDTVVGLRDRVQAIENRLQGLEQRQLDLDDQLRLQRHGALEAPALPVRAGSEERPVPSLNLPLEKVLEVYVESPQLLRPFVRPCALTARSLQGPPEPVELELMLQGNYWMLDLEDQSCWLLPRPGLLERSAQLMSMERLFSIEERRPLPAELQLLSPARALATEQGRRWVLLEPGVLTMQLDPLRQPLVRQLALLQERLQRLEQA